MTVFVRKGNIKVLISIFVGLWVMAAKASFGQTVGVSPSGTGQPLPQWHALANGLETLLKQGATPQQVQAWQQQNAVLIQSVQQQLQQLAAAIAAQPLPFITEVVIPSNSSAENGQFIELSADLQNRFAAFHNQNLTAAPSSGGNQASSASGQPQDEVSVFHRQNAADFGRLQQLAKTMANQQAQIPVPMPPPLVVPPNSSQATIAFLTYRDQFTRDRIAFMNAFTTATPEARFAASQQWMQQNAGRLAEMQILAQTCKPTQ